MPEPAQPFRLGVNYWPSAVAMEWLARYDPVETRCDFARMGAAGIDTVRVFARWEDVQPTPNHIDTSCLARLVDAANLAATAGLELIVTLFTGHMSGVNYIPAWATEGAGASSADPGRFRVLSGGLIRPATTALRNWYGDPDLVDAHERLASAVGGALQGHPAVWAWDLGNENSNCTIPPNARAGDEWMRRTTSALRDADPGCLVTIGTHMEDLEEDRVIDPAMAARWCDFVCMHGYPIYASFAEGPTDAELVPFLAAVTQWLAGDAPVLFEELGLPTVAPGAQPSGMLVTEDAAASYTGAVVDGLWEAGSIGAMLWCANDYTPALYDQPPFDLAVHERTFGLWRADGSAKPAVGALTARAGRSVQPPPAEQPWIDIGIDEFHTDRRGHLARLYASYRRLRLR
jgi:endo-1,4-beta-mannosidase